MAIKGRGKDVSVGKGSPPWMTTYSDLVTQLLIFFVMLFALSAAAVDEQLKKIKEKIDNYVEVSHLTNVVFTKITQKEGLVVSLREKLMFDSGKADVHNEAKRVITDIVRLLQGEPNRVAVEGHTDNVPIATQEFPSNWELSTARATNTTRFLIEELKFNPKRLSSAGYGEYQPIASNATINGRAENRRVDIVVRRLDIAEMKAWREKLRDQARKTVGQ
ncbi:MAG: OmpA family protein [Endomicrobiales bacterium]|nr:OmpA family protein [Endomicrobiales bacterium]